MHPAPFQYSLALASYRLLKLLIKYYLLVQVMRKLYLQLQIQLSYVLYFYSSHLNKDLPPSASIADLFPK